MSASANLALPFIEGGELLPDVTLNETLRLIDTLVQLAILDRDLNAPPGAPAEGQRWIVKASPSPTGAWAGHGNHVAAWQDGGWVFCVPQVGWFAYVIDEGALIAWSGRSEEHTSELQSRPHLVCRLLLEKKKRGVVQRLGETKGGRPDSGHGG